MNIDEKPIFTKISQKDRMLSAIREIIFRDKKDFDTITVIDICKKAKVSRKSFYRYYKNKHDLIYDMMIFDLNGFEKLIDDIIKKPVIPVEKLKLLQEQFLKTFSEDFTQNVIDHFRFQAPQFWEINLKRCKEIVDKFYKVVEEGIQAGSFRKDINPHMVIFLLYCSCDSDLAQKYIPERHYSQPVIIKEIFNIILKGILNDS